MLSYGLEPMIIYGTSSLLSVTRRSLSLGVISAGTYPHNAGAPHGYPAAAPPVSPAAVTPQAFPAGVPVPPTRGEPAWRGPNHGVYPDISAPTAATAPHVHAAAREPLHHQGAYPAATVPAEAANGQRAHAHAAQQQSEGCQPVGANMKTAAHEPIPSAPLYVPAPNRVSAASSVPRDDLWYTSEPLAAGRASLEEPIRYPTVGELTPNASNGPNEELDEPSAADVSESTEVNISPCYSHTCTSCEQNTLRIDWSGSRIAAMLGTVCLAYRGQASAADVPSVSLPSSPR